MNLMQLDRHPNVNIAPELAFRIARMVRDTPGVAFRGPRPAQGGACSMCNRRPGMRQQLFEILLDPVQDEGVRIGIDICAGEHLKNALETILEQVESTNSPDRTERERRLRAGIAAVSKTVVAT